jgi:hypothetical protein
MVLAMNLQGSNEENLERSQEIVKEQTNLVSEVINKTKDIKSPTL